MNCDEAFGWTATDRTATDCQMSKVAAALLVLAGTGLSATPLHAVPIRQAVEQLRTTDVRVAAIGYRLFTRNAARCAAQMPATGLLLHSLGQYSGLARPAVLTMTSVPSPVSVLAVVDQAPAGLAGVRPGDGIEAINGVPLPVTRPPGTHSSLLRDQAETRLNALPPSAPIVLLVRRGDAVMPFTITPVPACRTRLAVVAGKGVIARSDGQIIQLGQDFAERIDDNGIAVALAHELAHSVLGHRAELATLEAAPNTSRNRRDRAALARRAEDEADLLSLHLLAGAGWDPAIAPGFFRRAGRRFDSIWPGNKPHRSAAGRAARMELEIAAMVRPAKPCSGPCR
jgi:hypothetical protein